MPRNVLGPLSLANKRLTFVSAVSSPPTFGSSGFQWMTINSIDGSNASGIGQNNITVLITQTGGGMFDSGYVFNAGVFPIEYGVPVDSITTIANTQAGIFTATFSQPVKDPLVAFASVGQPGTPVPVIVSRPFTPVWSLPGYTTYLSPTGTNQYTQFVGEEGYNIIKLDGMIEEVIFNYTVAETWCNVLFGFVDQNV